jgi:hypothetical protein
MSNAINVKCESPVYKWPKVFLDVGSGSVKIKKVEFANQEGWKIVSEVSLPIGHQQCLEESNLSHHKVGELSDACIADGLSQIAEGLRLIDANCKDIPCIGIATAWARAAKNTDVYIDSIKTKFNILVIVLSHAQEAAFGWLSAMSSLTKLKPNIDPGKIIIWDIGGGSFQQVAIKSSDLNSTNLKGILADPKRTLHTNLERWGSVNFAHELYQHLGITNTSRLLVKDEVDKAIVYARDKFSSLNSTNIANLLRQNLDMQVYAIGEFMNKGFLPFNIVSESMTRDWAYFFRATFRNNSPETLCTSLQSLNPVYDCSNLKMIETNLLLITAIMDGLGIKLVHFLQVTDGEVLDYMFEQLVALSADLYNHPGMVS